MESPAIQWMPGVKGDNASWGPQLDAPHKNTKIYAIDNTQCKVEWCIIYESEFQISFLSWSSLQQMYLDYNSIRVL